MNYNIHDKLRQIEKYLENNAKQKWMTIKEAANWSRLSVSTLRRAIDEGKLKASHSTGKLIIRVEEIDRFLGDK